MTFDQQIQIWMVVGTWIAGIATFGAVVVALYLARKAEKLRLKVHVGLRDVVWGDGTPIEKHLCFDVTNLADRPVTITSVGWAVGKRKHLKLCVQPVSGRCTDNYPIELSHGKYAKFMVSFREMPNWPKDFAQGFVGDVSEKNLKTLVALIQTSVGQTIRIRPEPGLLEVLRKTH